MKPTKTLLDVSKNVTSWLTSQHAYGAIEMFMQSEGREPTKKDLLHFFANSKGVTSACLPYTLYVDSQMVAMDKKQLEIKYKL